MNWMQKQLKQLPMANAYVQVGLYQKWLGEQLKSKGIPFEPRIWISTEWFCPDSHSGFAVPFYLFHPEWGKIHKKYYGYIDGGTEAAFMKNLMHELGHAIDNAYDLRAAPGREVLFGDSDVEYPESYRWRRHSQSYVKHISKGYAQSHPDEDFAETFAVWMSEPQWRKIYRGTPALKKLIYMDQLMNSIKGIRPQSSGAVSSESFEAVESLKITLKEHYSKKPLEKNHQRKIHNKLVKNLPSHLYSSDPSKYRVVNEAKVCTSLEYHRHRYVEWLASEYGEYKYNVNYAITKLIDSMNVNQKKGVLDFSTELSKETFFKMYLWMKKNRMLEYYL